MVNNKYDELSDQIYFMQKDISRIDQYSRRANIEISGISTDVLKTDLENKVLKIFSKVGVDVTSYDIVAVHRLKLRKGQMYPNVIVRFFNRNKAYDLLKNKKELAKYKKEFPNVYFHDNLCPSYQSVFDDCYKLKRSGKLHSVWSHHGVVQNK